MARFTSFLAAEILVAALICFTEICDASPTKCHTTPATTEVPSSTSVSNMTTPATDMTTAVSNMTTPATDMTTTVSNMTTTTSNMTTAVSNMTTSTSNMTTALSNMTTSTSNMTTPSVTSRGTTSAPAAQWRVNDANGNLCMLMEFDGTITDENVETEIPSWASTDQSDCSSSSYSAFVLEFSPYRLVLNFTAGKSSYKLNEVTVSQWISGGFISSSVTKNFFSVPFGDYYTCSEFNCDLGQFEIKLTDPIFQPFVKKTDGGNSLGQRYVCRSGHTTAIVIGVIVAILVIIAIIGVTYCICKRLGTPFGYTRV